MDDYRKGRLREALETLMSEYRHTCIESTDGLIWEGDSASSNEVVIRFTDRIDRKDIPKVSTQSKEMYPLADYARSALEYVSNNYEISKVDVVAGCSGDIEISIKATKR